MIRFFLLFLFSFSLNCLAIEAHKAEYILSLYESTQSSGIYGIEGKSIYTLKEECSGWDSEEDLMVNFQLQDNVESKLISKWATFETFSGKSYQFDLKEKINDQNTSNFFGFANISKNIQDNIAVYISDKEYQIILDENNLNPTEVFFIDDSPQHIDGAKKLGIQTYHLQDNEEVISLFPDITQ